MRLHHLPIQCWQHADVRRQGLHAYIGCRLLANVNDEVNRRFQKDRFGAHVDYQGPPGFFEKPSQ